MTKAIEKGIPKLRIEQAAARTQAAIDGGSKQIVGVNIFQQEDKDLGFDILEVENDKVYAEQVERLNQIKASRDNDAVNKALDNIQAVAAADGNLLGAAVEAARLRATLGEISSAMEAVFDRHRATNKTIQGVYSKSIMDDETFLNARKLSDRVASHIGRRPRILIAKLGQDGHDRGARVIATGFADLGFDVDIGPLFQTPAEVVNQAIDSDVHLIGISSLAAGHKTLVPAVIDTLKERGRQDIAVIVGGVIPPQDYDFLFDKGVLGVFGPGTILSEAAGQILQLMLDQLESK